MATATPVTATTLTVQQTTNLTAGTVSAMQPAQSINASTTSGGGDYNLTYSTYTAGTDGFAIGTTYAPSGWAWGDSIAGWMSISNSSGAFVYGTGGLALSSDSYQISLSSSVILPICQNESFTVAQSYYTSTGTPPLIYWWFIPSGTGACTLASSQDAVLPAGKTLADLAPAVRRSKK